MLERLRIDITRTALEVHELHGWGGRSCTLRSRQALPAGDPIEGLKAAWAKSVQAGDANRSTLIALGDDWLRFFMVVPPPNAQRLGDCRAAAGMRFERLYGEPDTDWDIRARWHATRPFVACAAPRALVSALHAAAEHSRLRVRALVPALFLDWPTKARTNSAQRRAGWVVSWDGGAKATAVPLLKGQPQGLRSADLTQDTVGDAPRLRAWLDRQALLMGVPAPQALVIQAPKNAWHHATVGAIPCQKATRSTGSSRAWSEIDFAKPTWRRVLRSSWLGYAALTLAIGPCASAGWQLSAALQEQRALQDAQAELEAKWGARARVIASPTKRPTDAQVVAVNRAIHQLNLPWASMLEALEAATPARIALLSVEPDAREQRMNVTAEAATPEAMLAYLSQLKERAPLGAVKLIKHEVREQDPMQPVRFWIETHWRNAPGEASR